MIEITEALIDPNEVLQHVASNHAGAVVLFLGTTRQFTGDRETGSLHYECYAEMARAKMEELVEQARQRWTLAGCSITHRVGHVGVGEVSVAVAVSSPHRQAAFESGQWLIDQLKQVVPIWKKENWVDGTSQWVHPGWDPSAGDAAGLSENT
jgi:molybdopterin synthase catalytic subunit